MKRSTIHAYGFNSKSPIPIIGEFQINLKANNSKVSARFLVLNGEADNLLGFYVAKRLGLISINEIKVSQCELSEARPHIINNETNHIRQTRMVTSSQAWNPKGKYPLLFEDKIGLMKGVEISIEVDPSVKPIQIPPYPIPVHLQDRTKAKLEQMERDGVIERVQGPFTWISPIHVVPKFEPGTKKLAGVRITSNNKAVNKAIIHQKRYMPSIRDLTYSLSGMTVFSKVDIKDAFNQCSIADRCRHLTAFSTQWGTYQYCRLNMGLAIASELFQQIMTEKLKHIPNQRLATDDIIVYGKDKQECAKYTDMVLETLAELGVTLSVSKCEFLKSEITFYGHKISANGLTPLKEKMEDFKNMNEPRNPKELHSFLGSAGYFSNRSPHQATKSKRLRALLKKGGKWEWTEMHANDMQQVKDTLITHKMAHFNRKWITELIVDAGPEACASFLTQVNPQDPSHRVLIHCASHEFSGAELNYAHIEKEAYACVWACLHDHLYLYGNKFNLITDNIGVQKIFQEDIIRRKIPPRLERLKSKLAPYNVTVIHRPGLENIADYLSRRTSKIKPTGIVRSIVATEACITLEDIKSAASMDDTLIELKHCLKKRFRSIKRNRKVKAFDKVLPELRVHESGIVVRNDLIVMPSTLQAKAIRIAHEGHLGIVLCKRLLRNRCWWPEMDAQVNTKVGDCAPCQANVDTTHHEPLIQSTMPLQKNGLIAIDFSSRTPTGEYVLVAYDEGRRYPSLKLSRTLTSNEAIRICEELFDKLGTPNVVKSDNGPAFASKQFAEFATRRGFTHRKICPLNPEANGAGERFMKVLNKSIRCANVENVPWKNTAGRMVRNYRATPHTATSISPDFFTFSEDRFDRIPTLRRECSENDMLKIAQKNDESYKHKMVAYADINNRAKVSTFKIGDTVMLKWMRSNKHQPLFDPHPYIITEVKGSMLTAKRENHVITRNSRFFKLITKGCYEHAMSLIAQKPAEKLKKSVTFIFTNEASEVRETPQTGSPANPPIASPLVQPTSRERITTQRRHTVDPEVPHESRIRHKPDFYDEHKKTHEKSGS